MVKNPPANAEDVGSIPGSERSPGGGNGNPLRCSHLENPMGWQTTVHRVAKSWTRLSMLAASSQPIIMEAEKSYGLLSARWRFSQGRKA